MFIKVTFSEFIQAFEDAGRQNQFSDEAFELLFRYLDEEDVELDAIGICCDFVEVDITDIDCTLDELEERTTLLGVTSHDTVVHRVY